MQGMQKFTHMGRENKETVRCTIGEDRAILYFCAPKAMTGRNKKSGIDSSGELLICKILYFLRRYYRITEERDMGLFDKKYCDICGEKIGLLGNRKLEDGNLCKDCARKLSPFFSDRRNSTVEEIRQQLAYREENERRLADFRPDSTFGRFKKVYVDRAGAKFIVTTASNWRDENPDLISFSQVTGVDTDIRENKKEIYYKDDEGKSRSYSPRRYEYDYEFNVTILVDSPWFDKIELELSSGNRPDSPYTSLYRQYEEQMHTLYDILNGSQRQAYGQNDFAASADPALKAREQEIMETVIKTTPWYCRFCKLPNMGTLNCSHCGEPVSDESVLKLAKDVAKAQMMLDKMDPQGNSAPIVQSVPQSWNCSYCGAQNSGNFCESCGAKRP